MVANQGTFPPDEPEDTGPASDHTEAEGPADEQPSGSLHPYSVEVLKALGVHDVPATSEEDAICKVALWMYRSGQMTVKRQSVPANAAVYLESITALRL